MDIKLYTALVAIILPALVSSIIKPEWPKYYKILTAFGLSCFLAFGQVYISGACDFGNVPKLLAEVFGLVMTSYSVFWRPTGAAEKIEEKVNLLP
jgi:prepilin signal peptidase PulO-like enzyme (type II secretory pathway)